MLIKWILSVCVYVIVLFINIRIRFFNASLYLYLFFLGCFFLFAGLYFILRTRLKKEHKLIGDLKPIDDYKLIISTVFKNEGETVVKTLKHYLNFQNRARVIFYDDQSDDGSFEKLKKIESFHKGFCEIKSLKRTDKVLHPKGMGFEDLTNNYKSDYILILDADTIINESEIETALSIMNKNNLKVLHFTRRNDLTDDLANNIADTEELFSTMNKVIGIFPWYFNGSGFIIDMETAKKMIYDEYSPSDDCQISFFLRKNRIRILDTISLFAHEKAPTTIKNFIKQHSSWTKGGIHHYLEKERFTIFPVAFISAYFLFALFNPFQLYNLILPLAFVFIFFVDFLTGQMIAGRGVLRSLRNALLHTLSMFFKVMVIVPYHIFTFPFKRFTFWFSRTQY